MERAEQTAEYIQKTKEKQERARKNKNVQSAELRQIESKRADGRGHREESGRAAACRELGIARSTAQDALKIASLPEEAARR